MPSTPVTVLKGFLWFIAVFHVFVGLSLNLSPRLTQAIADAYGARVSWTPQLVYILKPLGAFMIAFGILAAAATRDPVRYSVIVLGFVILFAIRALQRIVFLQDVSAAFVIPPSRVVLQAIVMGGLAVALFAVYRWAAGTAPR
jgi:hypothetical protein